MSSSTKSYSKLNYKPEQFTLNTPSNIKHSIDGGCWFIVIIIGDSFKQETNALICKQVKLVLSGQLGKKFYGQYML